MPEAPLPIDERERLQALHELQLLDTPAEERFDRLTRLVARYFDVPIAMVSLVDGSRQWFKSCVGLEDREHPRNVSFCAHALLQDDTLIVEDAQQDPRFADNPLVTDKPFIRFYAGRVLRGPSGHKVGTLCVIGQRPRRFSAEDERALVDFAALAARELSNEGFDVILRARVESEASLRAIMHAVADAILTFAQDGVIESVNPAAERIFGRPAHELVGRPVGDFLEEGEWSHLAASPEGEPGLPAPNTRQREVVARRGDGTTFLLETTLARVEHEGRRLYVAVARDVSERRAAQLALEQSLRQNELLLSSADDGIVGFDAGGRIVFVNPAASRMLGLPADAIVGRHLDEAMPRTAPDGRPVPLEGSPVAETLHDGVTRRFERILSRADGTTFPAELVAAATRDDDHELGGAVVVFRDVTERHEIDRMKDEFLSVVGHELRTPLTSIRGAIALLDAGLAGDLPPQGKRVLDIAVANSDRLMRLINDILDLSRIESGRVDLRREPHTARELLEATVPLVTTIADEFDVTVTVDADDVRVAVDAHRMAQVLTNLASNAIKFSPRGGVVELRARREGELVRFEVRDKGRGIPADLLEAIFERFQQVDASDAREKGGTGLGLAIARSIVDQHGGRIWAESEEGHGSTFLVALPALDREILPPTSPGVLVLPGDGHWGDRISEELRSRGYEPVPVFGLDEAAERAARQPMVAVVTHTRHAVGSLVELRGRDGASVPVIIVGEPERSDGVAATLREGLPRLRPRKVLIVEDDADLADVLATLVQRHAETVQVVYSGRQAIDAIEQLEPDLIVLDLMIPEEDGFAVVERLRRDGRLGRTALVVYTALDLNARDRERLERSGASVVEKGVTSPDALDTQLARLLDTVSGRR